MDRIEQYFCGRVFHPWEEAVLASGGLYLVGGAVRDILLGRSGRMVDSDYIVTQVAIDRLMELLAGYGRTDLVGKSFGVIKFKPQEGVEVDVSLPRTESSTGTGHRDFDVRADPDIPVEEDLVRRDFTINSMALDLGAKVLIDPLEGRKDLEDSILRVNADSSFREDPLRILRGVQFMARFGLEVEERTKRSMKREAGLLATVSPERLRMELDKLLLLSERPSSGLLFMHESGILPLFLPELEATWAVEQNEYHEDDVFHHSLKACDMAPAVLHIRLAALFHDLGKVATRQDLDGRTVFYRHEEQSEALAEDILERLVYSRETVRKVLHLIRHHMFYITEEWSDSAVRRFISRVGEENIEDLLALRMADGGSRGAKGGTTAEEVEYARSRIAKVMEEDAAFSRKDLAVGGVDIMRKTGLEEGAAIGEILDSLLEAVLDDPSRNNREELLELAGKIARKAKKIEGSRNFGVRGNAEREPDRNG